MKYVKTGLALAISCFGYVSMANPSLAQTNDAAETCRQIAGAVDAGAPVSRDALNSYFSTLAKARPHCEAAVIGTEPDPEALFHLAVIMQREGAHNRALDVFAMAAEAGVGPAHTKLADYYNFGIGPIREDHNRAVAAYQKAAELGDLPAKSTLAIMYQIGRGVPQDFGKMLELLQDSADSGYHFAQFRLAELYMNPQTIPASLASSLDLPDPIKAAELYQMAADQGSQEAKIALAKFYEGEGQFEDPAVQLKWIEHAANNGNAQAINTLGYMHETGDGVSYDPVRAAELYIEALETGDLQVTALRGQARTRWDRDTAIEFQRILQERELYRGALDAIVGPGTLAAARQLTIQ